MDLLSQQSRCIAALEVALQHRVIGQNAVKLLRRAFSVDSSVMEELLDGDIAKKIDNDMLNVLRQLHSILKIEVRKIYDHYFEEIPYELGKDLSNRDRTDTSKKSEQSLLYGEIEFESFFQLLRKFQPCSGGVFYDLGSGTGKAVVLARILCDFNICTGIELLQSLHNQANNIGQRYSHEERDEYGDLSFLQASITDFDWSDGDFVFANSTNFDEELMKSLSEKSTLLKPGSIVVTLTKPIKNNKFEMVEVMRSKMSWGRATIYIQRRLLDDGAASLTPLKVYQFPEDSFTYLSEDTVMFCRYLLHRRKEKLEKQKKNGQPHDDDEKG